MKSRIVKRSVVIGGQKTSVSLEDAFWIALKQIAREQNVPLTEVITGINGQRSAGNLSSAIRLFVLNHLRELAMRTQAPRGADSPSDVQSRTAAP